MDGIPNVASCPVPESTAERTNRPIVTAGRGRSSSCPDTMREALPAVGEGARPNAPLACDARGHPVRCPKLTDSNRHSPRQRVVDAEQRHRWP